MIKYYTIFWVKLHIGGMKSHTGGMKSNNDIMIKLHIGPMLIIYLKIFKMFNFIYKL